jgi:Flp pilus assembly protein TadD
LDHPADELLKMRAAAEKAIQLDPLLAEAHDALGMVFARDSRWKDSEKSFRRAIELDPNRAETLANFAWSLLLVLDRVQEALAQMRVAEKSDPLSPDVRIALASLLISAGRYDEAAEHCQKLGGNNPWRSEILARARLSQSRNEEAIQLLAGEPNLLNPGFLGYAYARSGRREEAEKLAAAVSANPYQQTLVFAGLGDKDRTFEALDRMAALGAVRIGRVLNLPELTLIRGDPRVKALRKKVGLPE